MTLLLLSIAAGVLTVLSPCVLPVLPLLFARPGSARMFGGLAVGFGTVSLLAIVGGSWAAQVHGLGRTVALCLLAGFGAALAWPAWAARLLQPVQSLAAEPVPSRSSGAADWLVGMSTGLLWAPCAGPVLGLILTTATLQGGSLATAWPLLAYAIGAAAALLLLRRLIGRAAGRVPGVLRAVMPWVDGSRRLVGLAVLAVVALIAAGRDADIAAALPGIGLERLEQAWLDRLQAAAPPSPGDTLAAPAPEPAAPTWLPTAAVDGPVLPVLGPMPPLSGATAWLQSRPLRSADLRGKVVLVDFWTFGCINCQRALPSVREWARRYRDDGLVVIGVHTPEFAYERERGNVERALLRMALDFPIAIDNDFAVWKAWSNQYWPTLYLIDAQGRLRWRHIGEGAYAQTELAIRQLLDEARRTTGSRS